ncbi:uncharacterized protein LOC122657135 [Telopea speciosissima]|uniref:uncharacterized protein LOC122657135 n=1 Tax=Telopea speciosissima TaxID=54955 RepID=UPI001CC369E8|nr:uncharacterized protein LOC122657135 [Telopea speciosissima]XP_043707853.1 uncharacterized protein LOC122657135 [Telopea speciosissima]
MGDVKVARTSLDIHDNKRNQHERGFNSAFPTFFEQIPQRLQNFLKFHLKKSMKDVGQAKSAGSGISKDEGSYTDLEVNLDNQLQAWKANPTWTDQIPDIKVNVPKGSLCNLNVEFNVGLPPDAVFNIVIDPDNSRVFKNIKEVISRKVLLDEGQRQVVEVEQAALWRFLWWSGTMSVHVIVDQNRKDYSVKFKQGKEGFMKRFEGCWRVDPLFVDEQLCFPFKPNSWVDYISCTGGKGRVGSRVSLEQLIQPALVPPPPISWYLRGITAKTTEMLINDLQAEAGRIRGVSNNNANKESELSIGARGEHPVEELSDVKERWAQRRKDRRQKRRH